jgi:hypothetical protein
VSTPEIAADRMRKKLIGVRAWIGYAEACLRLQGDAGWQHIENMLQDEEKVAVNQLIEMKGDLQEVGKIQGGILMLRHLRHMPKMYSDRLEGLNKEADRLEKQLEEKKTLSLNEVDSQMKEFMDTVRAYAREG